MTLKYFRDCIRMLFALYEIMSLVYITTYLLHITLSFCNECILILSAILCTLQLCYIHYLYDIPGKQWETLSADLFTLHRKTYLCFVHYNSKFHHVTGIWTQCVRLHLQNMDF